MGNDSLKVILVGVLFKRRFFCNAVFSKYIPDILDQSVKSIGNKAFTDELKSWMRFNKKHQDRSNDGLSYDVFGAPNLPRFIVEPIMSSALNDKHQNKGDRKKIASSSHFVLFTTTSNTPEEWVRLGIIMERFLLKSTGLGIVHAYMNQPNEVGELSIEMAKEGDANYSGGKEGSGQPAVVYSAEIDLDSSGSNTQQRS